MNRYKAALSNEMESARYLIYHCRPSSIMYMVAWITICITCCQSLLPST